MIFYINITEIKIELPDPHLNKENMLDEPNPENNNINNNNDTLNESNSDNEGDEPIVYTSSEDIRKIAAYENIV